MSLYGMMRTGVSGMNAQAARLGTVADNIANANTTGYKRSSAEFSSLVLPSGGGSYNSGGVSTSVRYAISQEGALQFTTSITDLAIGGDGFFVVQDSSNVSYLTRAGSFIPDSDGNLVNAAGYQLMGYDYANGTPTPVVNGFDGLVPINVLQGALQADASTTGVFTANLNSDAAIVTGTLPSANAATSQYTHKSSLVVYDDLGGEVLLDFYYTKTAADTWEVSVFDQAGATAGTSFPYSSAALSTVTLNFDPTTGDLTGASTSAITVPVPGGQNLDIDFAAMTQLAYEFNVGDASVDGNAPSKVVSVEITTDGTVYAKYENGTLDPKFKIALADVQSPDQLDPLSGNVFAQNSESGVVTTGFAGSGNFGDIISGALESSNVDIAEELTSMIESQRSYTANSKVFQTGSDLMDVLVNLKR
ncbi:flagellar hook protein FlgE [Hoeflea sp. TYP-13]|uniref:flagellar hook protein FlgE n=1 Tax=Hoeflea sp. TYP-13 TaxID=3230023 RepID=UPI0034C6A511